MTSDAFELTTREANDTTVTVMTLVERIDASNYEQVKADIQAVYDGGVRHLLLDLGKSPFLSSTGLRVLHFAYSLLHDKDAGRFEKSDNFKLVNIPQGIQDTIRTVGFDLYVDMYEDVEAALASYGG